MVDGVGVDDEALEGALVQDLLIERATPLAVCDVRVSHSETSFIHGFERGFVVALPIFIVGAEQVGVQEGKLCVRVRENGAQALGG